jgi:tetratricopeptide (TPR) repeat protein
LWLRTILNQFAMTLHQTTAAPAGTPSETRVRELETGRLVERAVLTCAAGAPGAEFLVARAAAAVAALEPGGVRHTLERAVVACGGASPDRSAAAGSLVCYGGVLELHHQVEDAARAFDTALALRPEDPELMLHAARAHRKAGRRETALALYRCVRERGDARLGRFSALGEALLAERPVEALGEVLADAQAAGDRESAAVALEERARERRRAGLAAEAVTDLMEAAATYEDRRDRVRVAHALADLLLARGDVAGAREAVGAAAELSGSRDMHHSVQRLRAFARAEGDELGLRRWPSTGPSPLTTLMPLRRAAGQASLAPALRRWRDELTG